MIGKTLLATVAVAFLALPASAQGKPPALSWELYGMAENVKRYEPQDPRDKLIAANYFRKAAEMGNASAAYKLGEQYENGDGLKRNYREALKWYGMAAEQGDKYAQFKVGWFNQYGQGTRKDMREAAKWYGLSAAQDNEWAYHMLGFMLADGEGVRKDTAKARQYLELSVPRTDDDWGKWKLATLIGREDPARARTLLTEAAAAGNPEARKQLRRLGS